METSFNLGTRSPHVQGCDHKLTNESVQVQQATMQGDTRARWHFFCLTQDMLSEENSDSQTL